MSAAVERCEISDMPPSWCAHCRGIDLLDGQRPDETVTPVRGSFFVKCVLCRRALIEGEQVVWVGISPHCRVCASAPESDT